MKDTTLLVESVRKLLRLGVTSHLPKMAQKDRAADSANLFMSSDGHLACR